MKLYVINDKTIKSGERPKSISKLLITVDLIQVQTFIIL